MNTINNVLKSLVANLEKVTKKTTNVNYSISETKDYRAVSELEQLRKKVKKTYIEHPELFQQVPSSDIIENLVKNFEQLSIYPTYSDSSDIASPKNSNLSIILNKIKEHLNQIKNISNLPSDAFNLQQKGISLIQDLLPKIESTKTSTIQFVNKNLPVIEKTVNYIDDLNINISTITNFIRPIGNETTKLLGIFNQVNVFSTQVEIGNISAQLNSIQNRLENEIASLERQIKDVEQKKEDAENDKWWYLSLGVFGLIGLGIATGIIISLTNEANALKEAKNTIVTKCNKIKNFFSSTKNLNTEFQPLYSQISFLKDNIDFLISELNNIIKKLEKPNANRRLIKLYLLATITKMKRLKSDVI